MLSRFDTDKLRFRSFELHAPYKTTILVSFYERNEYQKINYRLTHSDWYVS